MRSATRKQYYTLQCCNLTLKISNKLTLFILKSPLSDCHVVLIINRCPRSDCCRVKLPTWLNMPLIFNALISLVKFVIKYCTSGEILPNLTDVLAPLMAMGIIADRTHIFVREMHAQYGKWRYVWKLVRRRPVAPQIVAFVKYSGVGGRMDVSCSVMEEDEAEEDELWRMAMLWVFCCNGMIYEIGWRWFWQGLHGVVKCFCCEYALEPPFLCRLVLIEKSDIVVLGEGRDESSSHRAPIKVSSRTMPAVLCQKRVLYIILDLLRKHEHRECPLDNILPSTTSDGREAARAQ